MKFFIIGVVLAFLTRKSRKKNNVLLLGLGTWLVANGIGRITGNYTLEYYTYFIFVGGMSLTYIAYMEYSEREVPQHSFMSHMFAMVMVNMEEKNIKEILDSAVESVGCNYSSTWGKVARIGEDYQTFNINFYPRDTKEEEHVKYFFKTYKIPYSLISFEGDEIED